MTTVADDQMNKLKEMEAEMQELFGAKQTILSQYNENTLVKSELDMLKGEQVFKLVGPLLYPIETEEAMDNVTRRLEYIEVEIKESEKKIDEKTKGMQALQKEIQEMQIKMQVEAAQAAQAAAIEATAS
jgi:prefoldin beta subunit